MESVSVYIPTYSMTLFMNYSVFFWLKEDNCFIFNKDLRMLILHFLFYTHLTTFNIVMLVIFLHHLITNLLFIIFNFLNKFQVCQHISLLSGANQTLIFENFRCSFCGIWGLIGYKFHYWL